jgi:hypothetical protein
MINDHKIPVIPYHDEFNQRNNSTFHHSLSSSMDRNGNIINLEYIEGLGPVFYTCWTLVTAAE